MPVPALIPFKPRNPKTRLSCILELPEREKFAQMMLCDVVVAAGEAGCEPFILGTEPFTFNGLQVLHDPRGLNESINAILEATPGPLLILMADVPLASAAAIRRAEVMEEALLKDIRYLRGLVYGLSAFNNQFVDAGYFGIFTQAESQKRAEVQHTIEQYFERVRRGKVTVEQVANAQAALKGNWTLDMEDGSRRASWLAQWVFELGEQPIPDYAALIDAVTVSDLQRMVETYYTTERRFAGLHHPIVTVPRGARILGMMAGVGAFVGLWRRLLRR